MSLSRSRSVSRPSLAAATAVEQLEARLQFDSTFVPISPTPLSQNWNNTALITTDDDWSGVPGVTGYRGEVAGSTADVDPQTITDERLTTPTITANQTDPIVLTGGGVAEFELPDPVVALQGSSSNDAPFLLFNVDSTGVSSVQVSYRLRDIDASVRDGIEQVALQYRLGESGPFVNVPSTYVADATTGPSKDSFDNVLSAVLPAEAGNQSKLQVRVMTTNANNPDEWVGVDDVVIGSAAASPGAFSFRQSGYTVGEGGGTATITVTRSGASNGAAQVHYAATANTADAGDFTAVSGDLSFIDGQTTNSFTIPITNDTSPESPELVDLTLSSPTNGATLGSQSFAQLTIQDNDGQAPAGVLLNEYEANPPTSADNPYEYIELRGPAGTNLDNVYVLGVEGDFPQNPGNVDLAFNLTGRVIGSNGILIIKATIGGHTPANGTTIVGDTVFNDAPAIENNANSFLVVYSQTPITGGQDLDPGTDDGVLELPAGAILMDSVGVKESGINGLVYGPQITQSSGTPDGATRFANDLTPNSAAAWFCADLQGGANSQTAYDGTKASANFPIGGASLTPGAPNTITRDLTPPVLDPGVFEYNVSAQRITLTFSESVSASFDANDFTLIDKTHGNTPVPASNIDITPGAGNTIVLTFKNYPGSSVLGNALPDARYELTVIHNGVTDTPGNAMSEDFLLPFFSFAGDANHDASVNSIDFNTLAANYGLSGRTFSQGDFNYNGTVDSADFTALATRFNSKLAQPGNAPLPASSLFSIAPIGPTASDRDLLDLI